VQASVLLLEGLGLPRIILDGWLTIKLCKEESLKDALTNALERPRAKRRSPAFSFRSFLVCRAIF
jgi:hypothetical protein